MINDVGCKWVILGHSDEKKNVFKEGVMSWLVRNGPCLYQTGLKVIACIGELLSEREAGKTPEVDCQGNSMLLLVSVVLFDGDSHQMIN
ncbi:triosephosphate isomerase [Desmophyllum pertusum]|uniref:Triosephosphate isomerase n=1 Tax=Desmophyllum pertusum TaxID=174260 RepID=A0A9W9ZDQ8_9CNID|nr:triosephosphate isomerase [Desmophyllum pertusum]